VPISIQPSANSGVTISVDQAQAYPLWATSTHLTAALIDDTTVRSSAETITTVMAVATTKRASRQRIARDGAANAIPSDLTSSARLQHRF
jgi:hypothetical protein